MKSFKYVAAAALTLLAVGCNKEQVAEVPDVHGCIAGRNGDQGFW